MIFDGDRAQNPSQNGLSLPQPVNLGAHRLMLRPRESRDLRLMSHTLAIHATGSGDVGA
jgi:hypothetical protein